MTQDRLYVDEAEVRVACHACGGSVTQVVQRVVRSQRAVRPHEQCPGGMVCERPPRSPERPPDWVVASIRNPFRLVESQPHECID
jgi:hypothetical protein